MPGITPPRESVIQRALLDWLHLHGCFAIRVNQQGVQLHDGRNGFRPGPTRGVSDILGALPGGRLLAVEVKRPGKKPTAHQSDFLERVNAIGGLGIVATSLDDLERQVAPFLVPSL